MKVLFNQYNYLHVSNFKATFEQSYFDAEKKLKSK